MGNLSVKVIARPALTGLAASVFLLLIYFIITSLISGWEFSLSQFSEFWYFIITLSFGFGVQVGLYTYLKNLSKDVVNSGKMVAISGTTSTLAMISCCSHYLANILPIIGVTGVIIIVSQYQIQLFYIGLLFNILGILYMLNKIIKYSKDLKLSKQV